MSKLIVLIGLALLAVAASALQQDEQVTTAPICPTEVPCCSCKCVPKGCPPVKRPDHCKFVGHCPVCPHKCADGEVHVSALELQQEEQEKVTPTVAPVCPTTLPCCSCKCIPKGCPTPKRPDHCKRIGHCPVCPHYAQKCANETGEAAVVAIALEQKEQKVTPAIDPMVCPTEVPCCSCRCIPKGCPPPKRPENCKRIGHCPVCPPNKCSNGTVYPSALELEEEHKVTPVIEPVVCPTELPCCSCRCVPKGCPKPKRPEHCKFVGHCPVCPHKCAEEESFTGLQLVEEEKTVTPAPVCPTTRPCCSCACTPKGCPPVQRPDHCKRIKCLMVCPHKCENETD